MNGSLVRLLPHLVSSPSIAQLVERWTVVVLTSIGRWFESGSKDAFFCQSELRGQIMYCRCGESGIIIGSNCKIVATMSNYIAVI